MIRNFIKNLNVQVNEKFELLLSGGSVLAQIKDDLTYDFEHSTEDNFWSILYLTGYLTKERECYFAVKQNAGYLMLFIKNSMFFILQLY